MLRVGRSSLGLAAIAVTLFAIVFIRGPSEPEDGRKKLEWDFPELVPHVDITHHLDASGRDGLRIWRVTPKPGVALRDVLRDYEERRVEYGMLAKFPTWWPHDRALEGMTCFYQHRNAHWRLIWHSVADNAYYLQWYDI